MAARPPPLRAGHQLRLLHGGDHFFPALVGAIDGALREVWLETYIFDFTGAGSEVGWALERAARRGVAVHVVVDGYGTPPLPPLWRERLLAAGVDWRVYGPLGRAGLLWPAAWRRLHRKLCVVDGIVGFCGGINVLDDLHDPNHGALDSPRLDFALQASGPLVDEMGEAMQRLWQRLQPMLGREGRLAGALFARAALHAAMPPATAPGPMAGLARAALVLRDNLRNRASIEKAYLRAIGQARNEIVIANAYFVPGGRMRRALVAAARRGVQVRLLLQGRYEYFMQYYAARPIYGALLEAGVEIHEYSPSFLHAKVAVVDGRWATVGSSNIDPLSLLLAREANVVVEDEAFAATLRERLVQAFGQGQKMDPAAFAQRPFGQRVRERVALVVMRLLLMVQGEKYL
jgi:cardiolipin synthase